MIFDFRFNNIFKNNSEAYLEPSRTSTMKFFGEKLFWQKAQSNVRLGSTHAWSFFFLLLYFILLKIISIPNTKMSNFWLGTLFTV